MKIVSLKTENVKRLKAVEIKPDGSLVVVGGRNEQGKSSVLDSIAMALGGKKEIPPVPIRKGEEKAETVIDLGEYQVKRTYTENGTSLRITNKEGAVFPSPQALLDGLVGKVSFDPLAFLSYSPAEQKATLQKLAGLDFSKLDQDRQQLYADRTEINREAKVLKAQANGMPLWDFVDKKIETKSIEKEIEDGEVSNQKREDLIDRYDGAKNDSEAFGVRIAEIKQEIIALNRELQECESEKVKSEEAGSDLKRIIDATPQVDIRDLYDRLDKARENNRQLEENARRKKAFDEIAAKERQSEKLTKQITELDRKRAKSIADAAMPVKGLGFDANGVTFNDLPLEQASQAQRLRVSVAMGIALNPKLRVLLIRDGSALDEENLALVGELAHAADAQVWLERVGKGEECSVIIEDGMIEK